MFFTLGQGDLGLNPTFMTCKSKPLPRASCGLPCIFPHGWGCHIELCRLCTAEGCPAKEVSGSSNPSVLCPQTVHPAVGGWRGYPQLL